jgi:hypothetical protein
MSLLTIALTTIALAGAKPLPNQDLEAVKVPLENYMRAQATGDASYLRKAFSTDAIITGHSNGQLVHWTIDEFAARFSGRPADDEALRKRHAEIIERTGNAAIGKVVLDYPTVHYTDYMSLLLIDGEWKIVNKSYHGEPK